MYYEIGGLEIKTSSVGRSGYLGVTVSPAWTLDYDNPFIAMRINPVNDPVLSKWLTATKRSSVHLGVYPDSREAAYVVSLYDNDPETILKELYTNKELCIDFPKEIYNLPENVSLKDAQKMVDVYKEAKKSGDKPKITKKVNVDLKQALAIARDFVKDKKIKNVPLIRKEIEKKVKLKMYFTPDDVKEHINQIAS